LNQEIGDDHQNKYVIKEHMHKIAIAIIHILLSAQTTGSQNQLFYWLFKSRDLNQTALLLLWFTGGPGCSSMDALFTENGPFTVSDNLTLILNPYSWNSKADLMFIDQPIGTGFSTGTNYSYTGEDYASNVYLFLINFMNAHSEYQGRDLYIT
jgi:cathepsin A (carboxypeptidase C)